MDSIDMSFYTATCSLFSANMEVEMDLISPRSASDSGTSSSGVPSTMPQRHALPDSFDMTELKNGRLLESPGMFASNGTATNGIPSVPCHRESSAGTSMFMVQQNSNPTNIMSFAAGNGGLDESYFGGAADIPSTQSLGSMSCTVRNLIGASVTTGAKLVDVDGSSGVFFVFPDLSIRKDGEYRFRFSFFDLKSDTSDILNTTAQIKARTFSEPFRVYSAKQFPGMIESTPLSKHFAKQGVKIPVRKESNKNQDADDDDWNN
ncbi:hypothetical protein H4218_001798 [Coemansia sp. IMI 209128]|uniref:Uncharacterized protein n=1 Tax=Coemansia linderi TaxID=2663919 RepID=A0ACC1KLY8_9FUNG|nr:hypothetical protein H4218_001798 [Coemansia sp. IMI 209128]KAJ2792030.1 hypothetical protein GGI18_000704 [Coemansia linderi]